MMKVYYGFWHNWFEISWPVRFSLEIILAVGMISVLWLLLKKMIGALRIKELLVKLWVFIVTELLYLFCKNNSFGIKADHRAVEWGNEVLSGTNKKPSRAKTFVRILLLGLMILGVIRGDIQKLFQECEFALSKGYESYPPLFVKTEKEEIVEETMAEEENKEIQEDVFILLNEKGKKGSNIRQDPSLDGEIIGGVNEQDEIKYLYEWSHDGERYWVKVCLPQQDIEGWLSGNLVDEEQLEILVY